MPALTRKLIARFCVAALALAAVACQSSPDNIHGPRTAANDPVPESAYPQITFQGDLDLRLVLLGEPIVTPATPRKPMSVRLRLRNATDDRVWVQYRFRFYGPDREPLDVRMPWQSQEIPPTLAADFGTNAMQVRAVDWELEVRPQ